MLSLKDFKENSRFKVIESQGHTSSLSKSIVPHFIDVNELNKLKGGACEESYLYFKSNYTEKPCALLISCPSGYSYDGETCQKGYTDKQGCIIQ